MAAQHTCAIALSKLLNAVVRVALVSKKTSKFSQKLEKCYFFWMKTIQMHEINSIIDQKCA